MNFGLRPPFVTILTLIKRCNLYYNTALDFGLLQTIEIKNMPLNKEFRIKIHKISWESSLCFLSPLSNEEKLKRFKNKVKMDIKINDIVNHIIQYFSGVSRSVHKSQQSGVQI